MSGGLADAVKNGPRAATARVRHLEARIRLAEAKAAKASQQASAYRAKAKGDGPLAKYRKLQADGMTDVANQRRGEADRLKVKLAKLKADQAGRDARHARHFVSSTRDEFGTAPASPGQRPGQVAKPGRASGQPPIEDPSQKGRPMYDNPANFSQAEKMRREQERNRRLRRQFEGTALNPPTPATQPKGHPMTGAISGEAVDIEQTEANIAQIKTSVADLRGALEGLSGSLASGGLNKLAGTFSQADDGLDSLSGPLAEAEKYLADQRGIAEAAQAAGEMHTNSSFYGAAGAGTAVPRNSKLLNGTRLL